MPSSLKVKLSTAGQGLNVHTNFGSVNCPMVNKVYSDDIFVYPNDKTIEIPANAHIPLNTIISKENLKRYNDLFKNDVYFYFNESNAAYVGFTKCNRDIGANIAEKNDVIALNFNNIDDWCIKSNEKDYLENYLDGYTHLASGEIKIIGGDGIFCDLGEKKPKRSWVLNTSLNTATDNDKSITDNNNSIADDNESINEMNESVNALNNSMQKVKNACGKIDVKELEKIYNLTVASTVTSGIGTASSLAGTVTSAISIAEQKKDDDADSKKVNGLNLATTITSAIGGATSGAGAITSGIASSKLKSIIDDVKKCKEEINKIQ